MTVITGNAAFHAGFAPARPAAAIVAALTARPVPPAGRAEDLGAAARRELAAAVRRAAQAAARGAAGARQRETAEPRPAAVSSTELGALIARITVQGAGLPVLPEPPSPSRTAFAEAVLALRSGIARNGEARSGRGA